MGEIRIAAVVAVVALGITAVGVAGAVGGTTVTAADATDASLGTIQTNTTETGNGTGTDNETATGIVAGGVTYGNGSGVPNPTVTVGSTTATTYESGGYVATVPAGTQTIAVSLDGEQVATRSVNVTANSTTVVDVTVSISATIQGRVTGSDGQPISPVLVELREPGRFEDMAQFPTGYVARTQPDADGYYQLSVEPGDYGLGAGSVEYDLAVTNVSLSPGETVTRNFTLDRADGGITGTVTDEGGTPIPNASVTTLNGTASATTGADGVFDLTMAKGTYTVVADADGYRPTTSDVDVQAGQTTEGDFALTERNTSQAPLAVAIADTSSPVAPGGTVAVDASLTNQRAETVSQTVSLVVDGATADDTFVSVSAGSSQSVTLVWTARADTSGDYTATVQSGDAAASTTLTVDPSLNNSDGSGTDGGSDGSGTDDGSDGSGTEDGSDGNESTDADPTFEGIGNESIDTDPTFEGIGNDSTDADPTFEGISNDTSQPFDGFNTSESDVPTFEFDTETGGSGFGFETNSSGPAFEFSNESDEFEFGFEPGSDAPTLDFDTDSGGVNFDFGDDSDTPTFNFSSD